MFNFVNLRQKYNGYLRRISCPIANIKWRQYPILECIGLPKLKKN